MADSLIVYEHPLSPYAQKIKIALREKQVDFAVAMPEFGTEAAAEFAQLNPRGEVPVLMHGSTAVFESSIILDYIEDTWPSPPLLPSAPEHRASMRVLENLLDTHFEANTWGLAEISVFGRAEGKRAEILTRFAEREIRTWYRWLEQQLGESNWFNGDDFGYGDLCAISHVNGAARFNLLPNANSALARWHERANQRESVSVTHEEAKAAELDPVIMQAALEAGFKREYRDHRLEWMIRGGGLDIVAKGLAADNIRFVDAFEP